MTKTTKTKRSKIVKSQKSNINVKKVLVVTKNKTLAKRKANCFKEMQELNGYTTKVNRNKVRSFDTDSNIPEPCTNPDFTAIEHDIKKNGKFVY